MTTTATGDGRRDVGLEFVLERAMPGVTDGGQYWTDFWTPTAGCSRTSAGCDNCWAVKKAWRWAHHLKLKNVYGPLVGMREKESGLIKFADDWNALLADEREQNGAAGERKLRSEWELDWTGLCVLDNRAMMIPVTRKGSRVYATAWCGDIFHGGVRDGWLRQVFAIVGACPQHFFLLLTKRPARAMEFFGQAQHRKFGEPNLTNWALGVSVESQATAYRVEQLANVPGVPLRWVRAEPLLGRVALRPDVLGQAVDWLVCGGESGPGARPMQLEWARHLRDQCDEAGVDFWLKSWGKHGPTGEPVKKDRRHRALDQVIYSEAPMVRIEWRV